VTQVEAAKVLGVNQPKVSALKGYKLEGFQGEAADALRYGSGA
jgi:predicted XRE-type DNA-binding protein